MAKQGYYAVNSGRNKGVYSSWEECQKQVSGYSGANFKKFSSASEARSFASSGSAQTGHVSTPSHTSSTSSSGSYQNHRVRSDRPAVRSERSPVRSSHSSANHGSSSARSVPSTKAIYTDGASRGNQTPDKAVAGYGVYFGPGDSRNIAKPLKGARQTNQRAELTAIGAAVKHIVDNKDYNNKYTIKSDSQYALSSLTSWNKAWEKNGWKNSRGAPVENKDLIQNVLKDINHVNQVYEKKGWSGIQLEKVKGHSGDVGNDMADKLANAGCDMNAKSTSN